MGPSIEDLRICLSVFSSFDKELHKDLHFLVPEIRQGFSHLLGKQIIRFGSDAFFFFNLIFHMVLFQNYVLLKPGKETLSFQGLERLLRPSSLPTQFASECALTFFLSKSDD